MPTIIAIGTVRPERDAQQQRELDVAHAHPGRVGERGEQQESARAEPGCSPFHRRMENRLAGEHEGGGGQHDPVRDDPPLDVGRGDGDERDAEDRGDQGIPAEPELEHAARDEQRRDGSTAG